VAETAVVVIVKYGDAEAPAATVTEAGTTAAGLLLVKATLIPPAGAGPVRLILFNVAGAPPTTDVGESATESKANGLSVRTAVLVTPLNAAEIVTMTVAETVEVVIVNAGDAVAPAATVTEAGGTTPGLLLVKVTLMPPAGAGPFRFTLFKVVETPPTTVVGESTTESSATGLTVRTAVLVTPLYTAEIVIGAVAETDEVVIVNAGDAVAPAATVTEAGGTTPGSLLVNVTLTPPAGAGPFRFTLFNVVETPPTTDVGERTTESSAIVFTVKVALLLTPFKVAVIVTVAVAETDEVVIVKTGDDVAPAATVTDAGTPTPPSLLDKFTTTPPAGAATLKVTLLRVVEVPPNTEVGDRTGVAMMGFTVRMDVLLPPL
jgi:hypothetical protein